MFLIYLPYSFLRSKLKSVSYTDYKFSISYSSIKSKIFYYCSLNSSKFSNSLFSYSSTCSILEGANPNVVFPPYSSSSPESP